MKKNGKFIFYIIFGAVLLLTGCSTIMFKNWGSIRPDTDMTNNFEKFQINANLNYYISGSNVYPTSILGLNRAYTLDTDLWKKIDTTPELFSQLQTCRYGQYSAAANLCMDFIYSMIKIIKSVSGIL
jgi:hypothetical protein